MNVPAHAASADAAQGTFAPITASSSTASATSSAVSKTSFVVWLPIKSNDELFVKPSVEAWSGDRRDVQAAGSMVAGNTSLTVFSNSPLVRRRRVAGAVALVWQRVRVAL